LDTSNRKQLRERQNDPALCRRRKLGSKCSPQLCAAMRTAEWP